MSSWESRVFAVVDEDKNCLCYLFDNWTDDDDNEVAETFKQYVEEFGTDRASLCTAMMYTGAKLYKCALWDAWDWEWEHGKWEKYEPSAKGYYNYKKIRKESKDFILRHPSIPDYLDGNPNEMISAFVGTGNVAMDHYRNSSAFITIKTLEEILNGSRKGAERIAKKEPKEKPARISGDSWKRICSECGKKMASGYVVGGGDEYYCSDKCLHKHYSEKQWNRMYKQNDEDNYWTEWGPGDELDESRKLRGRMLKEARKKEKKRPVESDFDVTEEQMLGLEDALGDERLYGGGIEDAAVKINAKKSGRNVIFAEISIYVLCDGDFGEDEDGNFITDPRWIKFDIDNAYKFYYGLNPDRDDTEEEWYCAGTTHYTDDDVMAIFEEDVTDYVQSKF